MKTIPYFQESVFHGDLDDSIVNIIMLDIAEAELDRKGHKILSDSLILLVVSGKKGLF